MAFKIDPHLEKAKLIHRLPSDYKLALVMGISQSALTNYRQGKTLPDARVISILCGLTGDDPAILLAQIEEVRAKTTEARALWHQVVERLRSGAVAAIFAALFLGSGGAFFPGVAQADQRADSMFTSYTLWNVLHKLKALGVSLICHFWSVFSRACRAPLGLPTCSKHHVKSPRCPPCCPTLDNPQPM